MIASDEWSSSEDDNDDDEIEEESFTFFSICSYCNTSSPPTFETLAAALEHDNNHYDFDLLSHLPSSESDEFYEAAIIVMNKARSFVKEHSTADGFELGKKLNEYLSSQTHDVDDETNMVYFKPQLEDDAMLMCIDELQVLKGSRADLSNNDEPTLVTTHPTETTKELHAKIELLEEQLSHAKKCITSFAMDDDKSPEKKLKPDKPDNDTYYFSSYSNTIIHETMLRDTVRTSAYESAILTNADSLFRGKTVLDIGCGTGVLSLFCAKAGAKKVIAVDATDVIKQAQEIIELNGYTNVITCVRGKIESLIEDKALPLVEGETVDVIVSEWMGYALFFETMLPSVMVARDALMTPGTGTMYPNVAKIYIEAANDQERLIYWDSVHGIDMRPMKQRMIDELTSEGLVEIVDEKKIISNRAELIVYDLNTCKDEELDFEAPFELRLGENALDKETTEIHQLVVSFDIDFSAPGSTKVSFSTGCQSTPTHWKQAVLWFDPINNCPILNREKNDVMRGRFRMKRNTKNHRAIDMAVLWETGRFSEGAAGWERTGEGSLKRSLEA